ncbi:MAG: hypothetical protein HY718_05935 [Planctomycetes bacterium]|nr:hypothetical protein [Planctomycetota bacterium]
MHPKTLKTDRLEAGPTRVLGCTLSWIVVGTKLDGFPMGWVQYDNITLLPEPATVTLLGLPALVLLRRRRRA